MQNSGDTNPKARIDSENQDTIDGPDVSLSKSKLILEQENDPELAFGESLVGGHLGINKTFSKITKHFYWPQIQCCVTEFCKTCYICQIVGKPNQKIPVGHFSMTNHLAK